MSPDWAAGVLAVAGVWVCCLAAGIGWARIPRERRPRWKRRRHR